MGNTSSQKDLMQDLDHQQWVSQIKSLQQEHEAKLDMIDDDKYALFISYLASPQTINGYSDISIITRMVRIYVGDMHGITLYNDNNVQLNGLRISIAIHPIDAYIYIADEKNIYSLSRVLDKKTDEINGKLNIIHKASKKETITDLAFSSNGQYLVSMINDNKQNAQTKLQFIDCKNHKIFKKEKYHILCFMKYKLNHYYLDTAIGSVAINQHKWSVSTVYKTVNQYRTLYTLDSYNKEIWFVENSSLSLVRMPLEYLELTNKKKASNKTQKYLDQLKAQCEVINLSKLLKLEEREKEINKMREEKYRNNMHISKQTGYFYVIAFDVDKLYGAIYVILRDGQFYRIEKKEKWKITHQASLKEALPLGMPLGTCSIKYDSVTGRVIIGDNYKIQALYI